MSKPADRNSPLSNVVDLIERLEQQPLTQAVEGRIYVEWTQRINPATGTRFKLQEIARIVGRQYGHVRNQAALVRSYNPNESVPYEPIGEVDLSQVAVARLLRRGNTP